MNNMLDDRDVHVIVFLLVLGIVYLFTVQKNDFSVYILQATLIKVGLFYEICFR